MAFDLGKAYGYDKVAAEKGAKMMVGPSEEDYVIICRIPNTKYKAEVRRVFQANSKILEMLEKQDEEAFFKKDEELNCGIIASTVVMGWGEGIVDNGKPVKFSVGNCTKMLVKYPDFKAAILEFATDPKNYPLAEVLDVEDVKKS